MAATEAKAPAPDTSPGSDRKGRMAATLMIAGLMAAEGAAVFLVARTLFGAGPSAAGADHALEPAYGEPDELYNPPPLHAAPPSAYAEIEVAECKPSNRKSGKLINLRIRISALVASAQAERGRQIVEANKARINDRVNTVIRSSEPKDLNEPGLESIKRRLKHELARVLGDEQLIQEVLIPEMLQSGSGL